MTQTETLQIALEEKDQTIRIQKASIVSKDEEIRHLRSEVSLLRASKPTLEEVKRAVARGWMRSGVFDAISLDVLKLF